MEKTRDFSTCKVTATFQNSNSAESILRGIQATDGMVSDKADTITIVETRTIRLERFPRRPIDSER